MAITKKWAGNGIKTPIPNDPQGDNLVNYDEGFTAPYRTPIKDGGVPIGMGTFNQLMFDITDEVIENKKTLNQVAQQVNGIIDDTQTALTSTWSSQLIDTKLSTAVAGVIDDNQITSTLTWSSLKISAEIGQGGGGGTANIDDNTISTDKVWSSFKTNEMVKGGRTISVSNWQAKEGSGDTTITNTTANAKMVNLSVKVKTNATADKYLGDVVVYYNDPSNEILRQSCVSQNITGATDLTTAMGMTILDAQDSLIIQSAPASGVQDFWDNVKLMENTSNVTGSVPEPEPLGEGLIFTAQASSSSVTFNKQGTPTELQLEYQTTLSDVTSGWQDYTLGTRIDLSPNDKVSFRNKGTQTITQTDANYHYFTMAGEIKAENDLTYLFNSTGGVDTIAEYGCYKMFANCAALTEMPDLNATNIGTNGYANMFSGCTKLKTIKPLNAITITNYSYKEMFKNCNKLLITETEGETSFLTMPATAPINAGDNMFVGTGGTFVGTPTANSSYFYNASVPTSFLRFTADEDNSTITFQKTGNSSSLNLEYKTNLSGVDAEWQNYSLGTIITLANKNDFVEFRNIGQQGDYSNAPRGRRLTPTTLTHTLLSGSITYRVNFASTIEDIANVIANKHFFTMSGKIKASGNILALFSKTGQVEKLGDLACAQMFKGCDSLIEAPELSAQNIGAGCFFEMFADCSNLIKTPKILPAENCDNLNSIIDYQVRKTTTPTGGGSAYYAGANIACRIENTIGAYERMFMNCSSLTTIQLAMRSKTLGANTFKEMFKGCSGLLNTPSFLYPLELNAIAGKLGISSFFNSYNQTATSGNIYGVDFYSLEQGISVYDYNNSTSGHLSTYVFKDVTQNKTKQTGCFYGMFENCSALEMADFEIHYKEASTSNYTFKAMFKNCVKLNKPPKFIGDRIGGTENFSETFMGCSALNISKTTGTNKFFTLSSGGGANMFTGTGGAFTTSATTGEYYYN